MLIPEKRLLEAFLKQVIKDFTTLNPESSLLSAEFFEDEGKDYKTAEDFLMHDIYIEYGDWLLNLEELCLLLDIESSRVKRYAVQKRKELNK